MRAYLAGPMRGIAQFNFPAFNEATQLLRGHGHTVFSPAERDLEAGFDPSGMDGNEDLAAHGFDLRQALSIDLSWICDFADVVAVLPGWWASSGARSEVAAAWALGIPVYRVTALLDPTSNALANDPIRDGSPTIEWDRSRHLNVDVAALPAEHSESRLADETTMVTSATGGTKGRKLERYDLIPVGPLASVARHYGVGAAKYKDRNWENGYDWSLSYAALHRHLAAFWSGTEVDDDPTLAAPSLHLAAVVFHALALMQFSAEARYTAYDDRPLAAGEAA